MNMKKKQQHAKVAFRVLAIILAALMVLGTFVSILMYL